MTTFKKIDWLRQLLHEGTKWKHSLAGQVKWSALEVKDPNNGSKTTVADLEKCLPEILDNCLEHGQVPFEFLPEVKKCLAYIRKQEKFDCKFISKIVQARKDAVCLSEILCSYFHLSSTQKSSVVDKIDAQDIINLRQTVQKLRIRLLGVSASDDIASWTTDEKAKQFKLIDWLRHLYLMCQKWQLNKKQGQLQWKGLDNAKDPNNSKEGSRMKLEELKEALKTLVPRCLEANIIPKPYLVEVTEVQRVLSQGLNFNPKMLEAEENLRKIATKLVDTLLHLEDVVEEVLATVEPTRLVKIFKQVTDLEKRFEAILGLDLEVADAEDLETEEVSPQQVEDVFEDLLVEDHPEVPAEHPVTDDMHPEIPAEDPVTDDDVPHEIGEEDTVIDGTDILLAIMDKATENQPQPTSSASAFPFSPSSGSEIFSEVSSPASPDQRSLDGHISDESGYYSTVSPQPNPLGIEDPEVLEEIDVDIFGDLDVSELPDVEPFLSEEEDVFATTLEAEIIPSYVIARKRKSLDNDFDVPTVKRAKR